MDLSNSPLIVVLAGIAIVGLIFWYVATEIDRRKRNVGTGAIALVVLLCIAAIYPPSEKLKGGIDLVGGSSFIVEVQPSLDENGEEIPVTKEAIQQVIGDLSKRLNQSGLADNLMQPLGEDRIIIEMPGVDPKEIDRIEEIIQRTATLEIKKVHPSSQTLAPKVQSGAETAPPGYRVYIFPILDDDNKKIGERPMLLPVRNIVEGDMVDNASPSPGQFGILNVLLTSEGGDRVRNATEEMTKGVDLMAIVLDGKGLIAPTVEGNLGRSFVIRGLDGQEEVDRIVFALNNPLRNKPIILSQSTISARYGADVINQGITAALAGLALTALFVLLYYRFAGIVALLGLCVNILILFGAMAMFGATFTLPGIAGIILTIGVAVDANVLIYERLREEMAGGKSLGNALKAAYEKAFTAIFDANITTLLTALILLWRASDQMKGFAITLTIGILSSMFAALLVTRVFFFWGTDTGAMKKLSFLNLIPKKTFNFMDKRKIAFLFSTLFIVGSLITVGTKGNSSLGIDFLGGSRITIKLEEDQKVTIPEIDESLNELSLTKNFTAQLESVPNTAGDVITIKCAQEDLKKIESKLRADIESFGEKDGEDYKTVMPAQKVDAALGSEFLKNSIYALLFGLVAVLLYISLRFEFSFAIGAFAALFHDIIICIGVVILWGTELSLIHLGAFLTIAGYSINDTIVVFDRIRETLRSKRGDIKDVMNIAINATLSRTILTSATTFVAVLVLFIFGGAALKDFSFAIMIGVIVGTYSSIFVAAPVVYLWSKARGSNLRQELLDANLEAAVSPAKKQSVGQLED